jgi:hypothetical protein
MAQWAADPDAVDTFLNCKYLKDALDTSQIDNVVPILKHLEKEYACSGFCK